VFHQALNLLANSKKQNNIFAFSGYPILSADFPAVATVDLRYGVAAFICLGIV